MRARTAGVLILLTAAFAAPVLAGFAGTDLFIPMAGRGAGAYPSNWFTTVYLYNPNATAVEVDLTFLERNKDNVAASPPKVTETLAPGETRVFENIVEATFSRTAYGAVRIQCAQKVVASARVFSKESESAPLTQSFGQDFAATPASFAIGLGETSDILGGYTTQPYQDSAARFNIGCVETTGLGSATVRWVARDGAGQQQKSYDRVVPRLSQTQGFFHQYFDGIDLTNSRVSASVVNGSGRVICYGSLVTNDKEFPKPVQDPTTFEMVYPEKLLGIATVQHDATLVGDGTAGAPLGIADLGVGTPKLADESVTPGKINTAGAAPGQLLKAGSPATWADDGLKLPFAGAAAIAHPGAVIDATNTAAGIGLRGSSADSFGVVGESATWTGVFGSSSAGPGVHGRSVTADGVLGEGSAAGKSGVYGVNDAGSGVTGFSAKGAGVYGLSTDGVGVHGVSSSSFGVAGESTSWTGVYGGSTSGPGVHGRSTSADGVIGESSAADKSGVSGLNAAGYGVYGASTTNFGVVGISTSWTGVYGGSTSGPGVHGRSTDDNGVIAEASAAGKSGILAVNSNASGYAAYLQGHVAVTTLAGGGAVVADANGVLTLGGFSDARLKMGVVDLATEIDVTSVLSGLRGVAFNWDSSQERARNLGDRREIGLIAQEVEAVLPQVVGTGSDGYKSLDYAKLTAFLIEVAKAQQREIDDLKAAMAEMRR